MSNDDYKEGARRLAEHLSEKYGWHLKPAGALEAIAKYHGVDDWNTLCATGSKLPTTQGAAVPGGDSSQAGVAPQTVTLEFVVASAKRARASDISIHMSRDSVLVRFRSHEQSTHFVELDAIAGQALIAPLMKEVQHSGSDEPGPGYSGRLQMNVDGPVMLQWRRWSSPHTDEKRIIIRLVSEFEGTVPALDPWGDLVLTSPGGMFVVAGATGSGKTTTASVIFQHAVKRGIKVARIDDAHLSLYGAGGDVINLPFKNVDTFEGALNKAKDKGAEMIVVDGAQPVRGMVAGSVLAACAGITVLLSMYATDIKNGIERLAYEAYPLTSEMEIALRSMRVQKLVPRLCKHCEGAGCKICANCGRDGLLLVSEEAHFADRSSVEDAVRNKVWWPSMKTKALGLLGAGLINKDSFERYFGELDTNGA